MSNSDTIKAITDNLETVLRAKGIKFERRLNDVLDSKDTKATHLPAGEIFFRSEEFEHAFGMRPTKIEAIFSIRVLIRERDAKNNIEKVQEWVHNVREAISVNALNIGDLSSSILVSRADAETSDIEHPGEDWAITTTDVRVRYREV